MIFSLSSRAPSACYPRSGFATTNSPPFEWMAAVRTRGATSPACATASAGTPMSSGGAAPGPSGEGRAAPAPRGDGSDAPAPRGVGGCDVRALRGVADPAGPRGDAADPAGPRGDAATARGSGDSTRRIGEGGAGERAAPRRGLVTGSFSRSRAAASARWRAK
jgi:hypothetical protein